MWKIIGIFFFIWSNLSLKSSEFVIVILDDCQNWHATPNNALKYKSDFLYFKDLPKNKSVSIGHIWYESQPKPDTITVTYSQFNNMEIFYSSEMSYENWDKLKDRKVFVLKPEDYCSRKRFEYGYQFILYESKILVSSEE